MRKPQHTAIRQSLMGRRLMIALALWMILAACGGGDSTEPSTSLSTVPSATTSTAATATTKSTAEPSTSVPSPNVGRVDLIDLQPPPEDLDEATRQAINDLVARTGAARGEVNAAVAEEVTWNDGSLGCPEPGKMYTQSLVPGLRVVLAIDGHHYAYHSAVGRRLFYCPSPSDTPSRDT